MITLPSGCERIRFLIRKQAPVCVRCTKAFFSRLGYPLQIHTDQGRNFESTLFKKMCAFVGLSKSRTTLFYARSDDLTERANRTILQMLRVTCEGDLTSWFFKLPTVLSAYRATRHKATGVTPNATPCSAVRLCSHAALSLLRRTIIPPSLFHSWNSIATICVPHALAREHLHAYTKKRKSATLTQESNRCCTM